MRETVLLFFLLLFANISIASEFELSAIIPYDSYTVERYYDGDTVYVNFLLPGTPDIFTKDIGIRVYGLDTPEIRTRCDSEKVLGYMAKDALIKFFEDAKPDIHLLKRGKYFRFVGDFIAADGSKLSEYMIKSNLAVDYFGATKVKDWCAHTLD